MYYHIPYKMGFSYEAIEGFDLPLPPKHHTITKHASVNEGETGVKKEGKQGLKGG